MLYGWHLWEGVAQERFPNSRDGVGTIANLLAVAFLLGVNRAGALLGVPRYTIAGVFAARRRGRDQPPQ